MSYQIKSTPFYKRIVTKRAPTELQRLKEEYDRIKQFDEQSIEMRIRQVRLRHLFREIDEINAASAARGKVPRRPPKSYTQMRAEMLLKARELGTEYSRENAVIIDRFSPLAMRSSHMSVSSRHENALRASTTARRIRYGNYYSNSNMQKLKRSSSRNVEVTNQLRSVSSLEMDKMEKLRNRINYGNSRSIINLAKTKRHLRKYDSPPNEVDVQQKSIACMDSVTRVLSDESSSETLAPPETVKQYTWIVGKNKILRHVSESLEDDVTPQTRHYNTKLSGSTDGEPVRKTITPTNRFDVDNVERAKELQRQDAGGEEKHTQTEHLRCKVDLFQEDDYNSSEDDEYTLRRIDNDRNLPLSQIRNKVRRVSAAKNVDSNEELCGTDETIIGIADLKLSEEEHVIKAEKTAARVVVTAEHTAEHKNLPLPASSKPNLKIKRFNNLNFDKAQNDSKDTATVKDIVKLYEPFPDGDPEKAAIKVEFESDVAKLRSIFEHQGI